MVLDVKAKPYYFYLVVVLSLGFLAACSSSSGQRASQGAAMGGIVGAAGGMISALVFGGNVGEAAARGAVWGASTGAVSGAIVGAQEDQAKKNKQEARIAKLKTDLGEDAFNGLAALVECRHETALEHARKAAGQDNQNYALAGHWLEIITYADQQQENKARARYPDLIARDTKISTNAQAEESMRNALQKLMAIRTEYQLPKTCR